MRCLLHGQQYAGKVLLQKYGAKQNFIAYEANIDHSKRA
jgi:hypothetical protein